MKNVNQNNSVINLIFKNEQLFSYAISLDLSMPVFIYIGVGLYYKGF